MKKTKKRKLRDRVLLYANNIKFYKLSLIKRKLIKEEREMEELEENLYVASLCPSCGKHSLDIEYGGEDDYMYCNHCGETFSLNEKTSIFLDALTVGFDAILFEASQCVNEELLKTQEWKDYCEKSIRNELELS